MQKEVIVLLITDFLIHVQSSEFFVIFNVSGPLKHYKIKVLRVSKEWCISSSGTNKTCHHFERSSKTAFWRLQRCNWLYFCHMNLAPALKAVARLVCI